MTAELPLLFEKKGAVALITLNRPARRNAMSPEVVCRLADAFDALAADAELRVAVLTGAGDRAFCSGGDLELTLPLLSGTRAPQDDWDRRLLSGPETLARSTLKDGIGKPVIAAINGACLAGGFEVMLGTDIRLAADHATFGLPEAQRGLIPFAGALVRLPRQVPQALAMEWLLTGAAFDAADALRAGLINRILPATDLLPAALAMAERIAANGPLAIAEIKRTAAFARGRPLEEGYAQEARSMATVMASQDAREGPKAFMERRAPVYRGR